MAAENPEPPEGAKAYKPSGYDDEDDEVPTINGDGPLDPGTVIQGTVVDIADGETEDGQDWFRLRINDESRGVIDYFAKGDVKPAVRTGTLQVGQDWWICKETVEDSFDADDGEVTYYPTRCAEIGVDS